MSNIHGQSSITIADTSSFVKRCQVGGEKVQSARHWRRLSGTHYMFAYIYATARLPKEY